jgi:hypothetical protein
MVCFIRLSYTIFIPESALAANIFIPNLLVDVDVENTDRPPVISFLAPPPPIEPPLSSPPVDLDLSFPFAVFADDVVKDPVRDGGDTFFDEFSECWFKFSDFINSL